MFDIPIFSKTVGFPDVKKLSNFTEPLNKSSTLGKSLLIISMLEGARDLASGEEIYERNIKGRQCHHIFPKKFLQEKSKDSPKEHVLNLCYIEEWSNKTISNKPPSEYIKDRFIKNPDLTEKDLKKRIESHLIPYEVIKDAGETDVKETYHRFIKTRAKLFDQKIQDLVKVPEF